MPAESLRELEPYIPTTCKLATYWSGRLRPAWPQFPLNASPSSMVKSTFLAYLFSQSILFTYATTFFSSTLVLTAGGKTRAVMGIAVLSLVANGVFCYVACLSFGTFGVAVASVAVNFATAIAILWESCRLLGEKVLSLVAAKKMGSLYRSFACACSSRLGPEACARFRRCAEPHCCLSGICVLPRCVLWPREERFMCIAGSYQPFTMNLEGEVTNATFA